MAILIKCKVCKKKKWMRKDAQTCSGKCRTKRHRDNIKFNDLSFSATSDYVDLPTESMEKFFDINGTIYKANKRYLRIGVTDGALYQSDKADLPDDEWEKCEEHGKR